LRKLIISNVKHEEAACPASMPLEICAGGLDPRFARWKNELFPQARDPRSLRKLLTRSNDIRLTNVTCHLALSSSVPWLTRSRLAGFSSCDAQSSAAVTSTSRNSLVHARFPARPRRSRPLRTCLPGQGRRWTKDIPYR
jgi:hypothetical protein